MAKTFLGTNLAPVVDLNAVYIKKFPTMHQNAQKEGLDIVEYSTLESSKQRMISLPCNTSIPAAGLLNYCGSYLSAGANLHQNINGMDIDLKEINRHSLTIPLFNMLVISEGSEEKAHALIDQGVDFASLHKTDIYKCDIFPFLSLFSKRIA
ncbi:hypothetical protein DSO57_1034991 [Entomophthora muscae]|uniref:Uncharacterized protein n=1 Tax=Entomophthora muscae TaxID=34485 RepID=A0ACC2REC9_9FUNG|nr:hypothetical protein DSO57_1034991 [Entomophthora muscae]